MARSAAARPAASPRAARSWRLALFGVALVVAGGVGSLVGAAFGPDPDAPQTEPAVHEHPEVGP
jgi:hypothetical protein